MIARLQAFALWPLAAGWLSARTATALILTGATCAAAARQLTKGGTRNA